MSGERERERERVPCMGIVLATTAAQSSLRFTFSQQCESAQTATRSPAPVQQAPLAYGQSQHTVQVSVWQRLYLSCSHATYRIPAAADSRSCLAIKAPSRSTFLHRKSNQRFSKSFSRLTLALVLCNFNNIIPLCAA